MMIKKYPWLIVLIYLLLIPFISTGAILINEVSAGGSEDWIELYYTGTEPEIEISSLYITMYRGTNERISFSPVTMKRHDDPTTSYDDRFIVIHFTSESLIDETDSTGDANEDSIRDIYCDNYGLWNTDCVISIDSDDLPDNDGIKDFIAFSNRDGSINSSIGGYIEHAITFGQWIVTTSSTIQESCCNIGEDGLNAWSTLSRVNNNDTNSLNDFKVTNFSTPGRANIFSPNSHNGLFKIIHPGRVLSFNKIISPFSLRLFIQKKCSIRLKIFNSVGVKVGETDLQENVYPGYFNLSVHNNDIPKKIRTGLYLFHIQAVAAHNGGSQTLIHSMSMVIK